MFSLRYRLTLRDLSEFLLLRGIEMSHETIRDWETKLLPVMGEALRKRRHRMRRGSHCQLVCWQDVSEGPGSVRGQWRYLYRAVGWDGNLTDAMLSEHRDMKATQAFFRSAKGTKGFRPDRVTTDGHGTYPRVIRSVLGKTVRHRTSAYLNNRIEQDHRIIAGSKDGSDVCGASRTTRLLIASVASMVNSAISCVSVAVTTSPSQPPSVAPASPKALRSRSRSRSPLKQLPKAANHRRIVWRET
jgi:transposase-like protein